MYDTSLLNGPCPPKILWPQGPLKYMYLDDGHSIEVQTHAGHSIDFNMFCAFCYPVTFDLKATTLLGYRKVIPYTKFEDFGIIRF